MTLFQITCCFKNTSRWPRYSFDFSNYFPKVICIGFNFQCVECSILPPKERSHIPYRTPHSWVDYFPAYPWWDVLASWRVFIFTKRYFVLRKILLMEEILHQLIGSLYHYLQGFIHPRWCGISSINSIMLDNCLRADSWHPLMQTFAYHF